MYRNLTPFLILSLPLALPQRLPQHKLHPNGNRIIGGEPTTIDQYPYQVSFEFRNVPGYTDGHKCGGSIISETFIVTAGHCTEITSKSSEAVVRVNTSVVETGGVLHTVKAIHYNLEYDPFITDNDISILELNEPIEFTAEAQPVGLPDKSDSPAVGTPVTVSGWGRLRYLGPSSDHLQVVQVPVIGHEVCYEAYRSLGWPVTDSMFCAGYLEEGGKDSCKGDSGGPAVADGKLYGIVSWGNGCAEPGYPGVFSDVSYLRDFITEVTGL